RRERGARGPLFCLWLSTEMPIVPGLPPLSVHACLPLCFPVYWTRIGPASFRRARGEHKMPRKVRDSNLETRTARSRLPVRHKPFFRLIEPGLHIGYRKLTSGPGTWLARRHSGEGRYVLENLRTAHGVLVIADDFEEADGIHILNFAQAQQAARGPRGHRRGPSYTVADAIADYLGYLEGDGRDPHGVRD